MVELSPISVSSVMRNPANDINNVAEESLDTKPTPSFFSGGCFDPSSLNYVLPQCCCEVLGQLYFLFHLTRVVSSYTIQSQRICPHLDSEGYREVRMVNVGQVGK